MVKFPNNCEWQNRFNPDNKAGLVWCTDRSKTTGVRVYKGGSRREHSFSLELHTMVFQAEIYDIKPCKMQNTEKGYISKNMYIISDNQAAIKALDNFIINSKSGWDSHQSLVKLAEHNRIYLIRKIMEIK
jgi:hypothetical protein